MMRFLAFASCLFLAGCAAKVQPLSENEPAENPCLKRAVPGLKNELYQASMEVYGNHISGLMFFKTLADSSMNVVFTTETGLTFFNFSWDKAGQFKVQHVIRKLDKKAVINLLRKDLELMIVPAYYVNHAVPAEEHAQAVHFEKETVFFSMSEDCTSIANVEVRHKEKMKTKVLFFPLNKNVPDSVNIEHLNFNMRLALGRIDRNHASQ